MSRPFIPKGPKRYGHQTHGVRRIIETRGVHGLLYDPGTGKTATTLDYVSLLALKSPTKEARVLVLGPLAAVDTWVQECEKWVHDEVSVWAEAKGGSTIADKAAQLAARGGNPKRGHTPKAREGVGRAMGYRRGTTSFYSRASSGQRPHPSLGPDALPGPRLVLFSLGIDSFASKATVKGSSKSLTDVIVDGVRRFQPDLIVLDESHLIKGPTSNRSRGIARLTALCRRRLILTGTPMPHSPMDIWAQWRFLDPLAFHTVDKRTGEKKPMTFAQFRDRYAVTGGYMGREVVGFQNLDEMQAIMAQSSTVARKADVLDLPKMTEVAVPVHLSPKEREVYEGLRLDAAADLGAKGTVSTANQLTKALRLRQVTSGYLPNDDGEVIRIGDSKARVIQSLVRDTLAGESRIVIFAHFKHEIEHLAEILSVKGTEVMAISGETPKPKRLALRQRFGDMSTKDRIVMVAQTGTMGISVNELVSASHAIFASLTQRRDEYEQAVARLDRSGQTKPVTIWVTQSPGTIDEVVFTAHKNRTALEGSLLAHILEGPAEKDD